MQSSKSQLPVELAARTGQACYLANLDVAGLATIHEEVALHCAAAIERLDLSKGRQRSDALGRHPMTHANVDSSASLLPEAAAREAVMSLEVLVLLSA